ncbi:MAG: hypothetical protein R3E01_24465 [Pirellulaceae bacterium]|nr:hypothetical protein [Planctomycetales bacterium]
MRVHAKNLGGCEPTDDRWKQLFQSALSRDNLWITQEEHDALVRGEIPKALQERIARFHLVDNTRGEPPMWNTNEIRNLERALTRGYLTGSARLDTKRGDRGYDVQLKGKIEVRDGRVVRFDIVALGDFWGEGTYTRGAPKGRFPLAISFTLADGADIANHVPPQGSRGWVDGYLH